MVPARRLLAPCAFGCALLAGLPAPAAASHAERRLVHEINDYRDARGRDRLRLSGSLSRSSDRYATHILRANRLHHHDSVWASSAFHRLGENLAWQGRRRYRASSVLRMWRESASHRRVLLDRGVEWIGVGRDYGRLGGRRATVWVLHVGRR